MPNANTTLIRRAFEEFSAGNPQLFFDTMSDDVTYTVIGTTRFSGTKRGRGDILQNLVLPLTDALEGPIKIIPENVFGDGDFVAMQARGEARAKSGRDYNNTYCIVFRFQDGKIAAITEYLDTELVRSALG